MRPKRLGSPRWERDRGHAVYLATDAVPDHAARLLVDVTDLIQCPEGVIAANLEALAADLRVVGASRFGMLGPWVRDRLVQRDVGEVDVVVAAGEAEELLKETSSVITTRPAGGSPSRDRRATSRRSRQTHHPIMARS